ncbi:MAG: amino acid transporter [Anaerolineaceae bacterium]|nr:amino acid transporter [Anaerolineaceae bacterium]
MTTIPFNNWQPISLEQTIALFDGAPFTWFIAGGYAVELFLGHSIREHDDVDVVVFREDQLAAQSWLKGWRLYAADPPGTLRPWLQDEFLPFGVHDIWGHRDGKQHWEMQLMLAESEHDRWFARFDEGIGGPRNDLFTTYNDVPSIRIEVQLLYKCRRPRPKDEADFAACLPLLSDDQCQWLATYIRRLFPDGHPWLDKLAR